MCFKVRRIEGNRLVVGCLCRQTRHDLRENAHVAPHFLAVAELLVRAILTVHLACASRWD